MTASNTSSQSIEMLGKFHVRRRHVCQAELSVGGPCIGWVVIAPNEQVEHMATFEEAISMMDIWINEIRCKLIGQQRIAQGVARA